MNSTTLAEYLASCCQISLDAGKLIMGYYTGSYDTKRKGDHSPVTDADIAANDYITQALKKLTPDIPVVAEEDESLPDVEHAVFWLVDPLDGTRAFVNKEPEFTVNIGLIKDRVPLIGVIYAPPQDALYFGGVGLGAKRTIGGKTVEITARQAAPDGLVVVKSKSHPSPSTQKFLDTLKIKEMIPGSSSIKFCTIAEGNADIYPRFGRTMEWDTAAGHAILNAAGGRVETADGKPFMYGKPGFENPAFIAYGKK